MRLGFVVTAVLLALAALAVAQTIEEPDPLVDESEQAVPGAAELTALAPASLELGSDLGNACVCLCRQSDPPGAERWGHYERSIVSGCRWSGRICVIDGALGSIGACTESPAPLD